MTRVQPLRPFRASLREAVPAPVSPAGTRWSREWIYMTFVMAAWTFTPLLRRLLDFKNGAFNPVQIMSLVPFLALLPLLFVCLRKERMARLAAPVRILIYIWCGTFAYGFLTAAAFGTLSAAAFELLQYLVPALAGIWIAGQDIDAVETMRRLAVILLPCAGVVAIYGVAQWIQPPPWDVLWVEGSHFTGADSPVPFGMRIFSTLNSPGTAADFIAIMMIFALPFLRLRRIFMWPLLAALAAALLLTLVREAWVALVVGAVVYLLLSPKRLRAVPPLAIFIAILVVLISTLPSLLGSGANSDVLTSRISTFGDVGHDASALARQTEINDALAEGLNHPAGAGLGNIGAAARLGSNAGTSIGSVLDSGYLARLVELGWLGFAGYLAVVVGGPIVILYGLRRRARADAMSDDTRVVGVTAAAMALALAWGDAASDAHLGLEGLLFWVALGLGSLAMTARNAAFVPAAVSMQPALSRFGRLT
jgi:putative inorganic carbon (HCO3(-)) transporter